MRRHVDRVAFMLCGAVYGAAVILLSRGFLAHLAEISRWFCGLLSMEADAADHIAQVLAQLKTADILSPWLWFVLPGACAGWCLGERLKRHGAALAVCAVMLLLPLMLIALYFTEINEIRLGALANRLLPALKSLI